MMGSSQALATAKCGYIPDRVCLKGSNLCPYVHLSSQEARKLLDPDRWVPLQCEHAEYTPGHTRKTIHVSDISQFLRCRVKWDFTSPLRRNLTAKKPNKHLWLGRMIHYAKAAYYGSTKKREGLTAAFKAEVLRDLISLKGRLGYVPEDLKELATLGVQMLEHYEVWAKENDLFDVVMPEVPLRVAMPTYDFRGKTDGLIRDVQGRYWLLEHKGYSRLPSYDVMRKTYQAHAYVWAAQFDPAISRIGPVEGILYNLMYKSAPTLPKLVSGNTRLEKRANMGITPELYKHVVAQHGFNVDDYVDILAKLPTDKYFRRYPIKYEELQGFVQHLNHIATQMSDPDVPIYPADAVGVCEGCEFMTLCDLKLAGQPWEELVDVDFKPNDYYQDEDAE